MLNRCRPLRPALVLTAAAAVAIVGSPIMRMTDADASVGAVLSALGWGGAVAIGLVPREIGLALTTDGMLLAALVVIWVRARARHRPGRSVRRQRATRGSSAICCTAA